MEGFTVFLCFTLYLRAISKYKPWRGRGVGVGAGAYIWRGDLTEGFLQYESRVLIFGGAYTCTWGYFRNFTVVSFELYCSIYCRIFCLV